MVRFPPIRTGRKPAAKEMRERIIARFAKTLEYLARG